MMPLHQTAITGTPETRPPYQLPIDNSRTEIACLIKNSQAGSCMKAPGLVVNLGCLIFTYRRRSCRRQALRPRGGGCHAVHHAMTHIDSKRLWGFIINSPGLPGGDEYTSHPNMYEIIHEQDPAPLFMR